MDPARYLLTTGVAFVNPANPGMYPANVPNNAAHRHKDFKQERKQNTKNL